MSVVIKDFGDEKVVSDKEQLINELVDSFSGKHVSVVSNTLSGIAHVDFVSVSAAGEVSGTYGDVDFGKILFD